jgi:tricorn protease
VGAESVRCASWSKDGTRLFFASSAKQNFVDVETLWYVEMVTENGAITGASEPARCELGPAHDAQFQPGGVGKLIGRHTHDVATTHWKGYKGGAFGEVWVDFAGLNNFERVTLVDEADQHKTFNVGDVVWATRSRIICVADDGSGRAQLCSFKAPQGESIEETSNDGIGDSIKSTGLATTSETKRAFLSTHTARTDFCVRHVCVDKNAAPETDRVTVAYVAGGKLFTSVLTFGDDKKNPGVVGAEVPIEWFGSKAQLEKFKLEQPDDFIDNVNLHPEGLTVVSVTRGRVFTMGLWDGPSVELEAPVDGLQKSENELKKEDEFAPAGCETLFEIASDGFSFAGSKAGGNSVNSYPYTQAKAFRGYAPRARLASYLWDATRVVVVRDAFGEDDLEVSVFFAFPKSRRLFTAPM